MEVMKTETKFAEISAKINPENGEVTLFISNEDWGPIVTGKNLAEAKTKMNEAFALAMVANSFCSIQHAQSDGLIKKTITEGKHEIEKLKHTLEMSF